jgi:Ala-tRNA(Pro) deacylase
MPIQRLKEFLDQQDVSYHVVPHSHAYTAQETAASVHIPGRRLAKTVIVKLDGIPAMAVLPADHKLDLGLLKDASGARKAVLATEDEFTNLFPNCELGAMPPFGNLFGMDVYIEESMRENDTIAFNAGTHTEVLEMSYSDFERLVQPKVFETAEVYVP